MAEPKGKPPAFQFYGKDWLSSSKVRRMGLAGRGLYIDLLCHCWEERRIPDDPGEIALLTSAPLAEVVAVWDRVRPCFQVDPRHPGHLVNARLERTRKDQDKYSKKRSAAGKVGAHARWGQSTTDHTPQEDTPNGNRNAMAMANTWPALALASKTLEQDQTQPLTVNSNLLETGRQPETLTLPTADAIQAVERLTRHFAPGIDRSDSDPRSTSIPKDEIAQRQLVYNFLVPFFPPATPGAGMAREIQDWERSLGLDRCAAFTRELTRDQHYHDVHPLRNVPCVWGDLTPAQQKLKIIHTFNAPLQPGTAPKPRLVETQAPKPTPQQTTAQAQAHAQRLERYAQRRQAQREAQATDAIEDDQPTTASG